MLAVAIHILGFLFRIQIIFTLHFFLFFIYFDSRFGMFYCVSILAAICEQRVRMAD